MTEISVAALYRFVALNDYTELRAPLLDLMNSRGIRGTLLLAHEGINGTIAGPAPDVAALIEHLRADPRLADIEVKTSVSDEVPFGRARVKLKKEIVTMGRPDIDPANSAGTHVEPRDWNALVDDPEVTLVDTRNYYEVAVGSFDNAIDPNTVSFRQFPDFAEQRLDPAKQGKVAMFCTGGIRCEKSTAYLKQLGFEKVYHLKGGILKYFEEIPGSESRWHGECFVFDERVTVDHDLNRGSYEQCHACRMPLSAEDRENENYAPGISCPNCHDKTTEAQRTSFAERRRQVELAELRGESHVGGDVPAFSQLRKIAKSAVKDRQRRT